MNIGENEQGLKKLINMTRIIAIEVLIIHCYYNCYQAFKYWNPASKITDEMLHNISHTELFKNFLKSKLIALGFLLLSLLGIRAKKVKS